MPPHGLALALKAPPSSRSEGGRRVQNAAATHRAWPHQQAVAFEQHSNVANVVFRDPEGEAMGVNFHAKNTVDVADNHLHEFVPRDWVLALLQVTVSQDSEHRLDARGYGLLGANLVYVVDFGVDVVVDKQVVRRVWSWSVVIRTPLFLLSAEVKICFKVPIIASLILF